jgi:endonuclease-3
MLSSQTKDAIVGQAIRAMQQNGVATVSAIAQMTPVELNNYIQKVGFHNLKTKYIKETVNILLERYNGDIPPNAKQMQELPGVGPKMAFICETVAWNRASGIGVDTHMHRIFNQLNWVKSKTPEQTRVQLEAWLPRDKWMDVNLLWVGKCWEQNA